MEHSSLPIIDFAAITGAPEERRQMLAKLGRAARDIGFFYLTGHGLVATTWWGPSSPGSGRTGGSSSTS